MKKKDRQERLANKKKKETAALQIKLYFIDTNQHTSNR
jgi:hypothetical protein